MVSLKSFGSGGRNMSNAVKRYTDEDGRVIVYGYEEDVSAMDRSTLDEWLEEKQRKEAISRGPVKNYVNCYHEPVAALNDVLDVNELGAVMKLIPYIRMNTEGALYYGGKRMSVELIAKALDRSVKQSRRIINRLYEVGVLKREKDGRAYVFSVDERFHTIGHVVKGAQFTKVLQVKTRTDIRNISIQAAGVFYKMLPFFNYTHFYLTDNPNEPDASKLRYISHREFADTVNVGRNVVNEALRELRRHGFVMLSDAYGNQLYLINPDIMTRRRDNHTPDVEAIRNEFAALADNAAQNGIEELPY